MGLRRRPLAVLAVAGVLVVALAAPGGAGGFSGTATLAGAGLQTDHLLDHVALRKASDDPQGGYAMRPGEPDEPVAVPASAHDLPVESVLAEVGAVADVAAARTAEDAGAAMTVTETSAGGIVLFPANRTFDGGDTGWTSSSTGAATPAYSPSQGNPTGALRVQLVGGVTTTEGTATWSTRFTYSDGTPSAAMLSYDQRTMLSGSLVGDNDWQIWLDRPGGAGSVQLDRKAIVVGPGPEGSELAFRSTSIAVPPSALATPGTYGLRVLTRLKATAATEAGTATGASVVYDNIALRVQRAQRAVPQNQSFDTDSSGWTSVNTGTAVGTWSPSDGQPPGSLRATLAGSAAPAFGTVLWEGTFFRAAPVPGTANLHYEKRILLGDNLAPSSHWEVRLRAPSGGVTLLSEGQLVPGPYPGLEAAWATFDVEVTPALLQEVGTYGLQVYTVIETNGGSLDGVSVAYDNVRLSLSGAPQTSAPENRTFDTSLGWSRTTTGKGKAEWSATYAALMAGVEAGTSAASGTARWSASFTRTTGRPDTAYLSYATRTTSCKGTVTGASLQVVLVDPAGTPTVLDSRQQPCGPGADGSDAVLVRHAPVAVPVQALSLSGQYALRLETSADVGAASGVELVFDDVRLETSALGYQVDATARSGFAGTVQATLQLRAWTSGEPFAVDVRRSGGWTPVGQVTSTAAGLLEVPVTRSTDAQDGVLELRFRGTVELEDATRDVLHVDSLVVVPVADPREDQGAQLGFGTVSVASDHRLDAVLRVVNTTSTSQRVRIGTDPGVLSYAALLPDPEDTLVTGCTDQVRDGARTLSLECTLAPGAVVPVSVRLTGNAAQGTGTYTWAVTVSSASAPQFLRYRVLASVTVI